MNLIDIYTLPYRYSLLYALLSERRPEQNISHKSMPTWSEHTSFVNSHPYQVWYAIDDGRESVGTIYLTRNREIGIQIFKDEQGKGYGTWAVENLLARHPGPALANVNPANMQSRSFWERLGGELIQVTYELRS